MPRYSGPGFGPLTRSLMAGEDGPCKLCGKKSEHDCSHADCPNRRPLTANIPDRCTRQGMSTGGYARMSPYIRDSFEE